MIDIFKMINTKASTLWITVEPEKWKYNRVHWFWQIFHLNIKRYASSFAFKMSAWVVCQHLNVLLITEAQQQLRTAPPQLTGQQRTDNLGEFLKPVLSMLNYASEVYLHFHPLKMQTEGNIWHLKLLFPCNSEIITCHLLLLIMPVHCIKHCPTGCPSIGFTLLSMELQ